MRPWHHNAASLFLFSSLSVLTACSGGGADSNNEGDIIAMDPPVNEPPVEEPSGIVNTPLPFHENFGDGFISNFDEADTQFFLSPEYKSLTTAIENAEYEDSYPSLWYPTCCFFVDEQNPDPAETEINLQELGIASDAGNPSLVLSNARVTVGQTRSELANPEAKTPGNTDRKKDSSAGDAKLASGSWGEFDLSQPYRVSFCVKAVRGGAGTMQIYVDSNQSNTNTGSSVHTSPLILNAGTPDLEQGQRVEINVPGEISSGSTVLGLVASQIGTPTSFLQFRVPSSGGAQVIIDDLLIEHQDSATDTPPACNTFVDATPPDAPEAGPTLVARDGYLAASWESVPGATSYDLAVNTSNTPEGASLFEDINSTSTTIKDLENGTTYYVFLRGSNSAGNSEWSPATSEAPVAPEGCSAIQQVDSDIKWGVWDGCLAPGEAGSVVWNGSSSDSFSLDAETEAPYFTANEDGTTTMDTSELDGSVTADLSGETVIANTSSYPRHFTWIGRMRASDPSVRGFEVEISLGETDGRRVKTMLRPDQGDGEVQLERFFDASSSDGTAKGAAVMDSDYHIYHVALTLNGEADVTAHVYRDGVNITDTFTTNIVGADISAAGMNGTGRDGGSSSPRLRIGDGSGSNPYKADIDWLIWTEDTRVSGLAPANLVGELPSKIGKLGPYLGEGQDEGTGSSEVLSENFDDASAGDGGSSSFFTPEYRATSGGNAFYNVTGSGSRILLADGTLSFNNARFSVGETAPDTPTTEGTEPFGDLDLSKPWIISFNVVANENADDGSGKCQVYVDNNTTGSSNSKWGSDSKVLEKAITALADGDQSTGPVTIVSDPADHVGTANSFLQFRCDSGVETPITIDNLVIQYQ